MKMIIKIGRRQLRQVSKYSKYTLLHKYSHKRLFASDKYSQKIPGRKFHPETLSLGLGYKPSLSQYAIKPPLYLSSTWEFENAQAGKQAFRELYHIDGEQISASTPLIYSRLNNPNMQIWEERLAVWEGLDKCLAFSSGMAAITTLAWSLLYPKDQVIVTRPIYGGTDAFFEKIITQYGIKTHFIEVGDNAPEQAEKICRDNNYNIKMIFVETPSNPNNIHTDIEAMASIVKKCNEVRNPNPDKPDSVSTLVVDNTFLGPIYQTPALHGADIVVYSATKFLGGHSDLIAGAVACKELFHPLITYYRTILGSMSQAFVGWLLLRSLETLSIRMERQAINAKEIAQILSLHPSVKSVNYPTLLKEGSEQERIYKKQCKGPGSLLSFDIVGEEKEAFKVLDSFELFHLAVSLGGTESLIEHPWSMTHADVSREILQSYGVSDRTIRMSVGVEHVEDLKKDVIQALNTITDHPLRI